MRIAPSSAIVGPARISRSSPSRAEFAYAEPAEIDEVLAVAPLARADHRQPERPVAAKFRLDLQQHRPAAQHRSAQSENQPPVESGQAFDVEAVLLARQRRARMFAVGFAVRGAQEWPEVRVLPQRFDENVAAFAAGEPRRGQRLSAFALDAARKSPAGHRPAGCGRADSGWLRSPPAPGAPDRLAGSRPSAFRACWSASR